MSSNIPTMDSEQASLSTIIIDSNGNPIGQVIYRCALCRKICDSSTDAMLHYQMDHVELTKLQLQQQQPVATSSGATSMNQNSRGQSYTNSSPHHQNHQHGTSNNRQQQFSNSTNPSTSSNSLLKRASNSIPNSLLKRAAGSSPSASASNSLLKRASNVMRCYQPSNTPRTNNRRSNNSSMASPKLDTIHRPYITTSASRAAKRHTNTASGGRGGSISGTSNSTSELNANTSQASSSQQQVTKTNSSLEDNSSTPTSSRARSVTPRHVQRTNQYTANLKAKINAQKSAVGSNTASSQKSTSSSALNSSQASSVDSTEASSTVSIDNSNTPIQKVDIKTYSLRPRSLSRRSVRIS